MLGEKKNYKYLRILEADIIKRVAMKERKNKKRVPQKNEKTSGNQVFSRNLIKGINT